MIIRTRYTEDTEDIIEEEMEFRTLFFFSPTKVIFTN